MSVTRVPAVIRVTRSFKSRVYTVVVRLASVFVASTPAAS